MAKAQTQESLKGASQFDIISQLQLKGNKSGEDSLAKIDWDKFNDPGDFMGRGAQKAALNAAQLQADAVRESALLRAEGQERGLQATLEQLGITREQFDPFLEAGAGALPELQQGFQPQQGSTAGGLDAMIAEIMGGDSFKSLLDLRTQGVQGQLSAGGLTRSGTALKEAAAIPTDLAFEIENMLFGRGQSNEISRIQGLQNLTQTGIQAAAQSAGAGTSLSTSIAEQLGGIGAARGAGLTGAAEAQASGIFGANQAAAQGKQNILSIASTFFSDPKLKKNIKKIGEVGPLNLVEWEWIDALDDSFVKMFPTMGYLSTQVKEFFPQFVGEFGSYDTINYKELNKELLTWL